MTVIDNPIDIVCAFCGSRDVSRDAWANWNSVEQQWVLGAVFDAATCHVCGGETRLVERPQSPDTISHEEAG